MVGSNVASRKQKPPATQPSSQKSDNAFSIVELKKEVVSRIRSRDMDIPLLPRIATRIMKLSSDPNSSLSDFSNVIKQDQFVTGQIIKIANSPVYGGLCDITNVNRAIVQIGVRTMKDLILGISMGATIFRNPSFKDEMSILWKHSMAVGYICQELAQNIKIDSEHAFLCGLLHDIGKPFLLDVVSMISKKKQARKRISQESLILVLDHLHQAVGGILARIWKFSDTITQSVAHHHEYPTLEGKTKQMANLVYISDLIAHQLDIGLAEDKSGFDLIEPFEHLGFSGEKVDTILEILSGQVEAYLVSVSLG